MTGMDTGFYTSGNLCDGIKKKPKVNPNGGLQKKLSLDIWNLYTIIERELSFLLKRLLLQYSDSEVENFSIRF